VTQRRQSWALAAIVGLAFALRVVGLSFQSLWRDEVDALLFATRPLSALVHAFVEPGQNGPLYFLLLRPWLAMAGQSEVALRFFSALFGVLTVPLVYRLGRRLFPALPWTPLLAALLAATSPYLVWYSQEGKMYALVTFLILLSMDRYLAALEQGGWQRWLSYVAVTSAACYVHFIGALIVPAQALIFVLNGRRGGYRRWRAWLGSMAALTVPYLPLLIWQLPLLLKPAATGYSFVPLQTMLLSLFSSYSLGVAESTAPWLLIPFVVVLMAAGAALAERGRWRGPSGVLTCWLFVPVAGLFLVTLVRPLYTARYLIFVLPAYIMLTAFGLLAAARRSRLVASLLLLAILAVNGWGLWLQATTMLKADFRDATGYVARHLDERDLLVFQIPHGRYSFDYYFKPIGKTGAPLGAEARSVSVYVPWVLGGSGQAYRWAEGLYTNGGMSWSEVDHRMAEITDGSRVVWLIATEVPMWDTRNLVQGWLEEHGARTAEARFVRVTVYRYELSQLPDEPTSSEGS
jgi:mannosyltransferase